MRAREHKTLTRILRTNSTKPKQLGIYAYQKAKVNSTKLLRRHTLIFDAELQHHITIGPFSLSIRSRRLLMAVDKHSHEGLQQWLPNSIQLPEPPHHTCRTGDTGRVTRGLTPFLPERRYREGYTGLTPYLPERRHGEGCTGTDTIPSDRRYREGYTGTDTIPAGEEIQGGSHRN